MKEPRLTKKLISEAIKKETGYDIDIIKGSYYYWFSSSDLMLAVRIMRGERTGIRIEKLNDLSLDEWVKEFKDTVLL